MTLQSLDTETTEDTTDDDDAEVVNKVISDLIAFIAGRGLELFKERMADKFRMDAPSKSGKSKSEIMVSPEGIELPKSLWRVDKGRTNIDPSGVQLLPTSEGVGFINNILNNDIDIWSELISEWGRNRGDIESVDVS